MKKCPMCAEQVQDDARVCRFCQHRFDHARPRSAQPGSSGCGTAIGGVVAVVAVLWLLGSLFAASPDPAPGPEASAAPEPAAAHLPDTTIAKCREMLAVGTKAGVIRARPAPNRIDVEDATWAGLDAATKDRTLQAVACDVWGTAMPAAEDYVVAYGFRSGKRLQMLSSAGMARE